MGGGKGGADFDPKGKSDNEIRRFCVAFMSELGKHIGADIDIPAGDIGVSPREIGWMFGQYKKQTKLWEGVLTGKGGTWGGSLIRPEATGYGLVYYVEHMIKYASGGKESFKGKKVVVSGSGNVAQYAALKAIELGATVVSLSDSQGALVASEGVKPEDVHTIAQLKVERKALSEVANAGEFKNRYKYIAGARPWLHVGNVDVALPCATQNEVSGEEAEGLVKAGVKFIAEGKSSPLLFEHSASNSIKVPTWVPHKTQSISSRRCGRKSKGRLSGMRQARQLMPEALRSLVLRWLRIRNECIGRSGLA